MNMEISLLDSFRVDAGAFTFLIFYNEKKEKI